MAERPRYPAVDSEGYRREGRKMVKYQSARRPGELAATYQPCRALRSSAGLSQTNLRRQWHGVAVQRTEACGTRAQQLRLSRVSHVWPAAAWCTRNASSVESDFELGRVESGSFCAKCERRCPRCRAYCRGGTHCPNCLGSPGPVTLDRFAEDAPPLSMAQRSSWRVCSIWRRAQTGVNPSSASRAVSCASSVHGASPTPFRRCATTAFEGSMDLRGRRRRRARATGHIVGGPVSGPHGGFRGAAEPGYRGR